MQETTHDRFRRYSTRRALGRNSNAAMSTTEVEAFKNLKRQEINLTEEGQKTFIGKVFGNVDNCQLA